MAVNTWSANHSRSWRTIYGWRTSDEPWVYQGQWESWGLNKGLWFFDDASIRSTLSGRTITGMRIYVSRRSNGGSSASGTAIFREHNYSSQPSSEPAVSASRATSGFAWGEGKWVTLPVDTGNRFRDGGTRGIALYSTSSSPYMIFNTSATLEITHEPTIVAPSTPTNFRVTSTTDTTVTVAWNSVSGADQYRVDRSDAGTWTTTGLSFQNTAGGGIQPGTTYQYRVRAENSAGVSAYTSWITAVTNPVTPTGLQVTGTTDSSVSLSWNAVTGATLYRIYRSDGAFSNGWTTTNTSTTNTSTVSPGTTYSYSVRAENSGGVSAYSAAVSGTTNPATPTGLTHTSSTANSISYSWNSVTGATYYRRARRLGDGTSRVYLDIGDVTNYTDTGLSAGTHYQVQVRSGNSGGLSDYTNYMDIYTTCDAPSNLTTSNITASGMTVSWSSVTGAESYELQRDGVTVATTTGTSVNDSQLEVSTSYTYRVRAINPGGESAWSANAVGTTAKFQRTGMYWAEWGGTAQTPRLSITTEFDNVSIDTKTEDFNTLDATKWPVATLVDFGGGRARIVPGGLLVSQPRYNFHDNDSLLVQVGQIGSLEVVTFGFRDTANPATTLTCFKIEAGNLLMMTGSTSWRTMAYDSSTHRWLRFRRESNLLHFETSADAVLWSIRTSITPPAWLNASLEIVMSVA